MQQQITVAQLGCGYWGPNLLRNLAAHESCRLVAVVESAPKRRAFVVSAYPHIAIHEDPTTVFSDSSVAAVVIATPAGTHFDLAKAAILAGKHVLVEKPLATSVAEANELITLAQRNNVVLMVGHTFLYNDAVHELRRLASQEFLGETFYMHSQRLNLGQLRSDVNVWWNLAPHDISILLFLVDGKMPKSVAASGTAHLQPGIEDVVMASLVWDNGISAYVHVSWLDPYKVRRLTIVGSQRMIVYDDISDYKLTILDKGFDRVPHAGERMDFDAPENFRFEQRQGSVNMPPIKLREPLRTEIGHFFECIANGQEPRTGGRHARDVVAILEAGGQSLATGGRPVDPSSLL